MTPSGRININCDSDPSIWNDGTTVSWPIGTYTLRTDFATVIGCDLSGHGGNIYRGRATVKITSTGVPIPNSTGFAGTATISGHLDYAYTTGRAECLFGYADERT